MSKFNGEQKAVALKYNSQRDIAPIVVASGMGKVAQKIVELADESGVPVYEDSSLTTLLSQLNLGESIPEELYQVIVDIYLYFLNFIPQKKDVSEKSDDIVLKR